MDRNQDALIACPTSRWLQLRTTTHSTPLAIDAALELAELTTSDPSWACIVHSHRFLLYCGVGAAAYSTPLLSSEAIQASTIHKSSSAIHHCTKQPGKTNDNHQQRLLRTGSEEGGGGYVVATRSATVHRQPTPAAHEGPRHFLPLPPFARRRDFSALRGAIELAVGLSFWLSFIPRHTHALTAADPTAPTSDPFETAEEAARAYDEAAILMSGRNAKTNFPVPRSANGEIIVAPPVAAARDGRSGGGSSSSFGAAGAGSLSQILSTKLRKCCKTPSPSLTCLRLDTEKSHIGVWQKRAGARADSSWVMTVELNKEPAVAAAAAPPTPSDSTVSATPSSSTSTSTTTGSPPACAMDDEERIALQMIEELLGRGGPASPSHGLLMHGEEGSLAISIKPW